MAYPHFLVSQETQILKIDFLLILDRGSSGPATNTRIELALKQTIVHCAIRRAEPVRVICQIALVDRGKIPCCFASLAPRRFSGPPATFRKQGHSH